MAKKCDVQGCEKKLRKVEGQGKAGQTIIKWVCKKHGWRQNVT